MTKLKAPYPWPGGKSRVARLVWSRMGDCENVIEPFFGSGAFLLNRPTPPRIETVNDLDCFVSNFWRSIQHDPEAVAEYADNPVSEVDLHARHRWLVGVDSRSPWSDTPYLHAMTPPSQLVRQRVEFRERMRSDPEFYDPKTAGWWCWGIACWIGSGWCQTPESAQWDQKPDSDAGRGVLGTPRSKVRIAAHNKGSVGKGVNAKGGLSEQLPRIGTGGHGDGTVGVCKLSASNRPQLADAYDIGRGVNGNGTLGTCAERRAWLVEWFSRLRDRLRLVRVCCGDWLRVCDSESVTTRLGTTGIFFDPPYSDEANRCKRLYSVDSGTVAHDVRRYCLERGGDPRMRLSLAGYEGEGHEELERHGWDVVAWQARGGYGNRSEKGKANRGRERLWFSPYCQNQPSLFDSLDDRPDTEPAPKRKGTKQ